MFYVEVVMEVYEENFCPQEGLLSVIAGENRFGGESSKL